MTRIKTLFVPDWGRYVPGFLFCVAFAFLGKNLDRLIRNLHNADVAWATFLWESAQLNYVVILLLGGILIRNTLPIPKILHPGISAARPIIKPGIIILGVHYVWADVVRVGGVGLALTVVFIFGTAIIVMWWCKRWGVSDGLGGIMGAGTGVCGVSAIIAASPVVKANPLEMAYAIGTVLLFGTLMLFTMPYIGTGIGLSESQFGAWSAVAILNTAQLVAAAEWYGPESLNTAVLINVARIMFLPLVVLFALWFYILRTGKQEPGHEIGKWQLVKDKFPIFILGFFLLGTPEQPESPVPWGSRDHRLTLLGHERGIYVVLRHRVCRHRSFHLHR